MSNRRFRFPFRPESEYPVPIPVRFWKSSSGIAKKFWEINIYLQYHWIKYWTILAWSSISNMAAFLQYRNRIFIIWLESEPDILILAEMGTGKEPKLPIWPDGTQNFFFAIPEPNWNHRTWIEIIIYVHKISFNSGNQHTWNITGPINWPGKILDNFGTIIHIQFGGFFRTHLWHD